MARKKATALPRPEPEMITVYGDIVQETEDAILVDCGTDEAVWLPKSQIEYDGERGDTDVEISLPDWLAEDKGLVDGQGKRAGSSPEDAQAPLPTPAGEAAAAVMESLGAPVPPATFTFRADVEHVYEDKYVLKVTNGQDGTASLEFDKSAVSYDGQDLTELEEDYEGIEFTVAYALAVEKHLPEFLGVESVPTGAPEDGPDYREVDGVEPQARPYKHKLRSEIVRKEIELSDAEKIAHGKDLVEHLEKEADYKETASSYSSRARNERKQAEKVIDILKSGREERSINCDVVADYNAGQLVYVESEWPHREIQRRPMTDKDRQLVLPLDGSAPHTEAAPVDASEADETTEDLDPSCESCAQHGADYPDECEYCVYNALNDEDKSELSNNWTPILATESEDALETEPDRSCGTCAHIYQQPNEGEDDPCFGCGQEESLPNWTPAPTIIPAMPQEQPAAGAVQ